MGDERKLKEVTTEFVERCDFVGARLKDRTFLCLESYDFLGEHYDHLGKSRALTEKTREKAVFVCSVLASSRMLTTQQILAIFGLLLYGASTLRICVAQFYKAMRFLSSVAACGVMSTKHSIPDDARADLLSWANIAATNKPVAVWIETKEPVLDIFVDASAFGWGALSVSANGTVLQASGRWTLQDWKEWNLHSSVASEPLGLRKAIAALVPAGTSAVRIHTDHLPLFWAHHKGHAKAYSYSAALCFLRAYVGTQFTVCYIEGHKNPADALSRAPEEDHPAPYLRVTSVAGIPQNLFNG